MKFLGAQQQSKTAVLTEMDQDVPAPATPPADGTAPPTIITPIVAAQTFSDRLREHMSHLKKGAKLAREEYITSRWLLNKIKEHKKAFLASIAFVFVPIYALGYFVRLHLFVDSVKQTALNLFNISGKESRASYLLWTIAVAILITTIEAFELFPAVLPKLTAAREKLGFRETNWNQFFSGHSRFSHVLVWLLMTSATIRRMRSTGFSTWILAPFFCMALSIDVNDILAFAEIAKTSNTYANTFIDVVRDVATIGYGVTFTAGVVVFLFVIPEENEVVPDEKGQVQIVQAHVSESGQFFAVAAIPQTIVKTIKLLAMGNERAENVIPAILSFFFHGIGFLFQGRFLKFIFTVAVSSMIWYDFYALHVVGTTVGEFTRGWMDMSDANDGTKNIMMVLKAFATQDHPKLRSLYWHTVIFFAYHLVSILDVLSFKKPASKA